MPLPTSTELESMTPMMRQYYEIKTQAKDAIVFFRMGDFYEIFGDDAEEVAPKLELVLTSRERGDKNKIPFCGVPHHAARNYWLRLVKLGYKIAVADQVEDPKEAKGLVKREIRRYITPGSVNEIDSLQQDTPNYLLAVFEDPAHDVWAVCLCDVSTGELRLGKISGEEELIGFVERFRPKEILARRFYHKELKDAAHGLINEFGILVEDLPEAILRDRHGQKALLKSTFASSDLNAQPCGMVEGGQEILAALLTHLKKLQLSLSPFLSVKPLVEPRTMILEEIVRRDLELFETSRRRQLDGSLFKEMNCTRSPMGARLLRSFLAHPLLAASEITQRHDAVAYLHQDESLLNALRAGLKSTPDLARLSTRMIAHICSPVELGNARNGLEKAATIHALFANQKVESSLITDALSRLSHFKAPVVLLKDALVDQPQNLGQGDGVFRPGYDVKLDQLNELTKNGSAQVSAYEEKLRKETGINSLKIKSHKTFGLLIEVTKANTGKVPEYFVRRQTMVNNERFVTDDLLELDQTLASAQENSVNFERSLYDQLLEKIAAYKLELNNVNYGIATLDVFQSLAWLAKTRDYCRAELSENQTIMLEASRHPVVEKFVGRHDFIPNNIHIDAQAPHILITGPNMAGKSTIMRQLALLAIMNQVGSFVPASKAKLPLFDRVFTRVGASDDLAKGQSTFLVEMSEAAQIMRHATSQSLVILDEIGRGTSTQDGLALASAILEELATNLRCISLFATHYHELVHFSKKLSSVRPMCNEVTELGGTIRFTHRLIDGASHNSFGIEVAKIAGLPEHIIEKAKSYLDAPAQPSKHQTKNNVADTPVPIFADHDLEQEHLQNRLKKLSGKLETLKIHRTTPLQALNILNDLKSIMDNQQQPQLFD